MPRANRHFLYPYVGHITHRSHRKGAFFGANRHCKGPSRAESEELIRLFNKLRYVGPTRTVISDDPHAVRLVRSVLDASFDCILGNMAALDKLRPLSAALEQAPYLDDDAAASAAYVARCLLSGEAENAVWAAQRGYDARDREAQNQIEDTTIAAKDEYDLLSYPSVQKEIGKQIADLEALEDEANDVVSIVLRARNSENA